MRTATLAVAASVVAMAGTACVDDAPSGAPPTTAAAELDDRTGGTVEPADGLATVCAQAAATVGRLRAPTDLSGITTAAAAIATQADAGASAVTSAEPEVDTDVDTANFADALAFVTDAAGRLAATAEPALTGDPAELADAVATLVGAFDELDVAATELGRDDCGADAWGRAVAAAAVDLTVAAG